MTRTPIARGGTKDGASAGMGAGLARRLAGAGLLAVLWTGAAFGGQADQGKVSLSWVTAQKPQSKLWYDQGTWWAALPQDKGVHLWRYGSGRFELQQEPGPLKGAKPDCECDVVLAKDVLFVLAFHPAGQESTLHAFKFSDGAYKEQPGYPVTVDHPAGVHTMTVDADSTGCLWTCHVSPQQEVLVRSFQPAKPEAGFSKPVTLGSGVGKGDISAVVAFKGHVGVLWSDSKGQQFLFRVHQDGKPADQWEPLEVVASGKNVANDHVNLAADRDGNVWAVTKAATGINIKFAQLTLRRRQAGGKWDLAIPLVEEGQNCTRPVVILDEDSPTAYVLYTNRTAKPNVICLRRVSLSDQKVGGEEKVLAAEHDLNNATDLKGRVTKATGLMVLAGAKDPKEGPGMYRLLPLGGQK